MDTRNKIDELFLKVALKDDKQAYKCLFVDFFAPLCVYAQQFVEQKNVCEDIVQDVFFNIWVHRKSLDIRTSTRNFLITAVKNSCIDYLRRKDVESRYISVLLEKADDVYNAEEFYSMTELETALKKVLAGLPDKIRIVFEQNRFQELTYAEIAVKNGISVKTVESYMTKALKVLRVELREYLPFILLFLTD